LPLKVTVDINVVAGVAQGVVTGIRGLCMGLGPALFGFVFYMFNVDLNDKKEGSLKSSNIMPDTRTVQAESTSLTDRVSRDVINLRDDVISLCGDVIISVCYISISEFYYTL